MPKNKRVTPEELLQLQTAFAVTYPKSFVAKGGTPRPLKVGIFKDLSSQARKEFPGLSLRHIKGFLNHYCRTSRYLGAVRRGAARVSLDGAFAGFVTVEEEAHAKAVLNKRQVAMKASRRKPKAAPETDAAKLVRLELAHRNAEISDGFYHSNGRYASAQAEIEDLKQRIAAGNRRTA